MPTLFKNIQPDGTMTIYLYGEVSDEGGDGKVSSREIVQAIDYCSENEIAGLVIRVNSIGGDVYPGIAIYNAILRARVPITVAIDGLAASIAGVIALAAPKVTIGRYARVMIHNVSGGGYGNKTELQALIDQIASLEASIADIIGRRMGISREEVAQRYTLRVTSRIKELCLPLHLAGGDKRKWGAKAPVERRFAAVEGCAVASLPVEGEESSTPNPQPPTLNPQPTTRALREGGAR